MDAFDVLLYANSVAANTQEQRQQNQETKFRLLLGRQTEETATSCVHNLSSYELDHAELSLLNKGLNFNTGPVPDAKSMTCAVEIAVRKIDASLRDQARSRAIGALSKLRKEKDSALPRPKKEALKRLQKNEAIVILPADKGNATVVLDRTEYIKKMSALLEDKNTYTKINRDPTRKIEAELQKLLADGVPKVHKEGTPLRPIVDFTRSPLNKLSGYLHRVLAPLAGKTATHVRNASDFVEKLKNVPIDDTQVMASFDVKSLFTSLPVDFAVECCKKALNEDTTLPERTPIEADDLCRLLKFCLSNTYFTFNKNFYRQTFGTAMGASVSVVCANLALESIESAALASFDPPPQFFVRYVDDCFSVINRPDVHRFLAHLNTFQQSIQFTLEEEVDGHIAFLDVIVERSPHSLQTTVYRKPTHTGSIPGDRKHNDNGQAACPCEKPDEEKNDGPDGTDNLFC
ncbi:uncharacterized protein LOC144103522 [Amblyomma americanum]